MRNGFTLVELLAVIVILAIILAVAIPSANGIVNNVKRNAFEESAKMVLKAIDLKAAQNDSYDVTTLKKTSSVDTINSELKLDTSNYNYRCSNSAYQQGIAM
jgi:type IV pilus assembly protein PilA